MTAPHQAASVAVPTPGSGSTVQPADAAAWLGIGGLAHLDLRALGRLHAAWPRADAAVAALVRGGGDLRGIAGPSKRAELSAAAASLDPDRVASAIARSGAEVRATEGAFGGRLDPAHRWPPVVSVLGGVAMCDGPTVAIVGTRTASVSGCRFAFELAAALARAGCSVVSGLAFGIDAAAHRGACDGGRPGVAVLAGGVANISPRRHLDLAARLVADGGLLVSHVPPDAPAPGWRFPVRNRLIAGLADAVVVVEAAARGGSLSTARHALDLDRPLFAVPGFPWAPTSIGTNALLADGALVCRGADDVLAALGRHGEAVAPRGADLSTPAGAAETGAPAPALAPDAARVLDAVEFVPVTLEAVVAAVGMPIVHVLGILGSLELAGLVASPTPATVVRTRPGVEVR